MRVVVGGGGDESCHPSPPLFASGSGGGDCNVAVAVTARQWWRQRLRWLRLCGGVTGEGEQRQGGKSSVGFGWNARSKDGNHGGEWRRDDDGDGGEETEEIYWLSHHCCSIFYLG